MNLSLIDAWRARRFFQRYLQKLHEYRDSRNADQNVEPSPSQSGVFVRGREGDKSKSLREELCQMAPEANDFARRLDVSPLIHLKQNLRTGAGPMTLNAFDCAVDPGGLQTPLFWQEIIDVSHKCLGAAETVWRRKRWAIINPIDWIAFLVRLPFLILRRAGLPASVEENVWANIIKTLLMIALIAFAAWLGVELTVPDLWSLMRGGS